MTDAGQLPSLTEDQARWVEVWAKTEDVAMHFNDLIMSYRLKAIGGVAVAAGLIGSVLLTKGADAPTRSNWGVFAGAMGFLAVGVGGSRDHRHGLLSKPPAR